MEEWLASIGLAVHAQAFRERGWTQDDFSRLTEPDLVGLGLNPDERNAFLRAALTIAAPPDAAAERRPLSMMFVDLVGSSRLAELLPSEDLMELIRRYGDFCAGPIGRYGGRIARMVGDGILALFCYPIANENDPERAVRAALAITQGVGEVAVPGGEPLAVRIGIATGRVVVGDLRTAGGVHRHMVIGSAPNLAARLQSLAPPGGIVVAEETYLRVRDRFVCADLGSFELRGLGLPHRAWQVLREVASYGRLPRQRHGVLVGRAAELDSLQAAWARAADGRGGVVLVSGEPGIGKSHLLDHFLSQSAAFAGFGVPGTVLLEGAALEAESPLRPVVAWLHRAAAAAGGSPDTPPAAQLATTLPGWPQHAAVLGPLVGEAPPPAGSRPEQVREARLSALEALLLAQAADAPLRLVAEDLHWFDPTSLELVARVARRLADKRVLLLLTARDDFDVAAALGWAGVPDGVALLPLHRLGETDVTALAQQLVPDQTLPESWLRTIARKADGVPLFVGEMVRELAARGETEAPAGMQDATQADALIPASIHELLAGRLDRLGAAKGIAQAAAVIGADLRRDVLAAVCHAQFGTDPATLEQGLTVLTQAGVLVGSADARRAGGFVHALLQDAAYQSLLREGRQALHGHTARALLACDPDVAVRRPELVALHLEAAAQPSEAVPYWYQAAQASLAASALREAVRHLEHGLAALDALPRSQAVNERKLDFMALLGPPLMAVKGFGSPEAAQLYAAANALCQELPESPRNFPIYWGWWRVTLDNTSRLERAQTLRARARQRRDPELLLQAYHCSWASDFFVGSYGDSYRHAEAGLAIYDQHDFRHHAHIYGGHDAKVCGHLDLALCNWIMGRPLSAQAQDQLSYDWAGQLRHVGSVLHHRESRLYRHSWAGDLERLDAEARAVLEMAAEHGMEDVRAKGLIFRGYALAAGPDPEGGRRILEEGWRRQCEIGTNEDFPVYVALLAEALIAGGQPDRALAALRDADADFQSTGLWFWRSEVRRMQAEAVLAEGAGTGAAREAARLLFDDALDIAEQQGAVMLSLRAATGLARIDPSAAALAQVRERLGAVAEDDDGIDLRAARALLAQHGAEVPQPVGS